MAVVYVVDTFVAHRDIDINADYLEMSLRTRLRDAPIDFDAEHSLAGPTTGRRPA